MKEKGVTKIALILLVLVCVFAIVACSDNVNTDGVVYVSYDTYAVVTGYIGTESDVKIAAFYKDLPVISIENNAFYDCTALTSVTIPDSVTSIGDIAFYGCTALKTVYYKGTAADWVKISIGNNNSYITNTKRYYYSESKPTGSGNYWHYVDGKPTVWPSDE